MAQNTNLYPKRTQWRNTGPQQNSAGQTPNPTARCCPFSKSLGLSGTIPLGLLPAACFSPIGWFHFLCVALDISTILGFPLQPRPHFLASYNDFLHLSSQGCHLEFPCHRLPAVSCSLIQWRKNPWILHSYLLLVSKVSAMWMTLTS